MGKCLGKLLPAPKATTSSVPDVHQSSEHSLKLLFDKEEQQHARTTEELTAILEEEVCNEDRRYCIVETDEVHGKDCLLPPIDSISSPHAVGIDDVAQNEDGSSQAQKTECMSPSPKEIHELDADQEGYKEPVEAEEVSEKEQVEPEDDRQGEQVEPAVAEEESENGQCAAEGPVAGRGEDDQKEAVESHEGADLTKLVHVGQILEAQVIQEISVQQYAGIPTRTTDADATGRFMVQPKTNDEVVNAQSAAEMSESDEPTADHVNVEQELGSSHLEAKQAEEMSNSSATVEQKSSPPDAVSEATQFEVTEAAASADKQHATKDCVSAADQPKSGSEMAAEHPTSGQSAEHSRPQSGPPESAADAEFELSDEAETKVEETRFGSEFMVQLETNNEVIDSETKEPTADRGNMEPELAALHVEPKQAEEMSNRNANVEQKSSPPNAVSEAIGFEVTEAAASAGKKAEEQHAAKDCVSQPRPGSQMAGEHPTSGQSPEDGQPQSGPPESAADAEIKMEAERPTRGEGTDNVEEQHDQRESGPFKVDGNNVEEQLDSGPSESPADAGTELMAEHATRGKSTDKFEEQQDQLESVPLKSAPDAGNELVATSSERTSTGENKQNQLGFRTSVSAADVGAELVTEEKTCANKEQHDHHQSWASESAADAENELSDETENKVQEKRFGSKSADVTSCDSEDNVEEEQLESELAAGIGNELVLTSGKITVDAAENAVDGQHHQLAESGLDAGSMHVEQPKGGETTTGFNSIYREEGSGAFETFIDAEEQFSDKRGDSDEEAPLVGQC